MVVDPGDDEAALLRAIGSRRVACVCLTHAHFDHMLAAARLIKDGAPLYVGAGDLAALNDERLNLYSLPWRACRASGTARADLCRGAACGGHDLRGCGHAGSYPGRRLPL